jgi:hypothetical protein
MQTVVYNAPIGSNVFGFALSCVFLKDVTARLFFTKKKGAGEISFSGRKNVATLEREFENIFGLYVQIGYKPASGLAEGISHYYTTGADDKKSLTQINREKEAAGCIKNAW